MFANVDALIAAIVSLSPNEFVSHHLFGRVPYAFSRNMSRWTAYKIGLSSYLDVDPQEIVLLGSAAIGFSLNPKHPFTPFHSGSDFDFGIINEHYFDIAWRFLRQARTEWLSLSPGARRAIVSHRESYIFTGTIAANWFLSELPFGRDWQKGLDAMAVTDPTTGRDVKIRIYKDFDCLRYYQANNIDRIRTGLLGKYTPDESAIQVDEPETGTFL